MFDNRICSAHQPAFLPWAGYIHKLMLCDNFVFMDIAKFRKRSFMHRNMIEINSMEHFLGLRLSKNSDLLNCNEVFLSKNNISCLDEIVAKIDHSYKKSAFKNDLDEFINFSFSSLKEFSLNHICQKQLMFFIKKFNIKINLINESEIISLIELKKFDTSERLLNHALKTNSAIYITGINSENYLDVNLFKKNKILNIIQKFKYDIFQEYQKCIKPLSIVHQISILGFKNIENILKKKQITKKEILKND